MRNVLVTIKKAGQRTRKVTCISNPLNGHTSTGEPLATRPNVHRSYRSTAAQNALVDALNQ